MPAKIDLRARRSVKTEVKDDGLTEQSHQRSCEIHNILNQYERTGVITHSSKYQAQYMHFPDGQDFKTMMDTVATATSMFEEIPSGVRKQFNNDPAVFLDFIQNPDNREAITEMGFTTEHLPPPEENQALPAGGAEPLPSGDEPTSA